MREGSLDAPIRHTLAWKDPEFVDREKLDAEMRRQMDICHTCRRCFNLCDSFPRMFDLIDNSETGELDAVPSEAFKSVVDACTLCDMCFMTKCPYVPPHEFDMDIPHLFLRYRAAELAHGEASFIDGQIAKTDRNGKLAGAVAPLANWATDVRNGLTRPIMDKVGHIHPKAALPKFHGKTLTARAKTKIEVNAQAPAYGKRKAVLYATCYGNYNNPEIGEAARAVLAKNGVETEVAYPGCCGMPMLEHGDIARVAKNAGEVAAGLKPWIEKGYDVIALVPSCALMLKFEWPLIVPDNADVKLLSGATHDIAEYIVDIAKTEGLAPGMKPVEGGVTVHLACHARAQNLGPKAAELLRLIPDTEVQVIERCSGHGGSWGIKSENFDVAIKIGRPVARTAAEAKKHHVVSECPLAGLHILQGMERIEGAVVPETAPHPIQLVAQAYGV